MSQQDISDADLMQDVALSTVETMVIELFRSISPIQREAVVKYLRSIQSFESN